MAARLKGRVNGRVLCLGTTLALITAAALLGAAAAQEAKPPAQYKKAGSFSGGNELPGCVLSSIRFGKHPDFHRIVLDFSVGQAGKVVDAPRHPPYRVEYREFPYRLKIVLEGVKYSETARVDTAHALPLSIVTKADNEIQLAEVFLQGPALFKVIEIDDPAKLAIDVKYLPYEPIPTVYAVQLQGVKDVQMAFTLLTSGEFPAGFRPDVIVIGNAVFVENCYLALEEAAAAVASLGEAGYPALVIERRGDELPRH